MPELPFISEWSDRVIWAGIAIVAALVGSYVLKVLARRWATREPAETADLVRLRRRETAASLMATALRYLLFLIAAVSIISIVAQNRLTTVGSGLFVILVLVFAAQRLLTDVIAGFFVLLENQYGVGDFIEVEPSKYAGVVESLGLRTTVMRDLNGDQYFIPNGSILAVKRSRRRYRTFSIELLTRDPQAVDRALESIKRYAPMGGARFLRPPEVIEEREIEEGLWLERVRADVPPRMEWLVEEFLVDSLKRSLGEDLVLEPTVMALDEAAVRRYQRTVLVR